ncbi:MAG: T9SS type A sorting domain-containing protein [Saprospiraceae bacterium]
MKNYFTLLALLVLAVAPKPIFAQTPQWHYLGDTVVEQTWASGILTFLEGDARYVAFQTYDNSVSFWNIKRFDGFSWISVDTNGLGNQSFSKLHATTNGILQLAYFKYEDNKFGIKKLIGNTWESVSESPALVNNPFPISYAFDEEKFYVAFADEGLNNKISVWKYDGGLWSVVGQPGFSNGVVHTIILKISNGVPWVAYEDWSLGSAGIVKKFDGNSWQNVGNQVFEGDPHHQMDFVVSNGIPYIAHADSTTQSRARVFKFDGMNWTAIGPLVGTESTWFVKLAIDAADQEPYILVDDSGPDFWGLSALHFDGTSWGFVGTRGFITNYWNVEFVINDGIPYVGYEFSAFGGGVSVQVFSPVSNTPTPYPENISFKISPNPLINDVLQMKIQSTRASEVRAQIFNMDGRMLQSASWPINAGESDQRINVSTLAKGVYVIQLKSKDGRELYTRQFVIVQ